MIAHSYKDTGKMLLITHNHPPYSRAIILYKLTLSLKSFVILVYVGNK